MRYIAAISILLISVWAIPRIIAQDSMANHAHAGPDVIDGAEHPELIPDRTAYRLYFIALTVPSNPTELQKRRQAAQLKMLAMDDTDRRIILNAINNFSRHYEELVSAYNVQATAANLRGELYDSTPLFQQLDELTQTTHDTLRNSLTENGWSNLDNHIQHEKRRMKIGHGEVER